MDNKNINKIYIIDTDILKDGELFSYYYALQRPERREKIDRIKVDTGKRLSLGAGIVMEAALKHAGVSDADIVLTPGGKPVLSYMIKHLPTDVDPDTGRGLHPGQGAQDKVFDSPCYFNISHTKNIAVCAVSDREVGIDIEHEREFNDPLIHRAFTEDEIRYVEGLSEGDRLSHYTRLWTIKESVM